MCIRALDRPVRLPALTLLAILLLAAALPVAADHVYSHRYLTLVHVTGTGGGPVANVTVNATYSFTTEGACAARASSFGPQLPERSGKTDANGFLALCTHAHAMGAGGTVRVAAAGFFGNATADPAARLTVVRIETELDAAAPLALVHARLWKRGDNTLEGIPVQGLALANTAANLNYTLANGTTIHQARQTDSYGDLASRAPANATAVRVDGAWGTLTGAVAPGFTSLLGPDVPGSRSTLDLAPPARADEPKQPTIPLPLLLAAAALALAGVRRAR